MDSIRCPQGVSCSQAQDACRLPWRIPLTHNDAHAKFPWRKFARPPTYARRCPLNHNSHTHGRAQGHGTQAEMCTFAIQYTGKTSKIMSVYFPRILKSISLIFVATSPISHLPARKSYDRMIPFLSYVCVLPRLSVGPSINNVVKAPPASYRLQLWFLLLLKTAP